MGLFDRVKSELGIADKNLLATGTLARGNIVSVSTGSVTVGNDELGQYGAERVCTVVVEVIGLEGQDAYQATCKHAIPLIFIPKLQEPGAAVAVRVDPKDPQHIELDLRAEVPNAPIILHSDDGTSEVVKTSKSTYTAAEILAQGSPCTVTVLAVIPLHDTASDGAPATGLILNVHRDGVADYQAQIGTHIPDAAVPKVVVGATLPAKWVQGPGLPTDVNLVTPDWAAIG